MSVYLPPSEYTPIFDANLFPSTPVNSGSSSRDATKLDYPIAQGAQTFPDGLTSPSFTLSSGGYIGQVITYELPTQNFNTNDTQTLVTFFPNVTLPNAGKFLINANYTLNYTSGSNTFQSYNFCLTNQSKTTFYAGSSMTAPCTIANFQYTWFMNFSYYRNTATATEVFVPCLFLGFSQQSSFYTGSGQINVIQIG
jgi:hypothetical protein